MQDSREKKRHFRIIQNSTGGSKPKSKSVGLYNSTLLYVTLFVVTVTHGAYGASLCFFSVDETWKMSALMMQQGRPNHRTLKSYMILTDTTQPGVDSNDHKLMCQSSI